jgi:universal stress protein E
MLWRKVMLAVPDVYCLTTTVVDRVGRIARGLEAEVELFASVYEPESVQPGRGPTPAAEVIAARVEEVHRQLQRTGDTLRAQGLEVRSSARWDYPMYEAAIRQVQRHEVDLLIMPARAAAEVGQVTLHYREVRLIEQCPCPVLLLKTAQVYSRGDVVAAVDPVHAYEFPEELDSAVIGGARMLAHALSDTAVHLYHSAAAPGYPTHAELTRTRLASLAERHNIPSANVHIGSGAVESALPAFVRIARPDVVVMGALSRTFPTRALLGHKAELVMDRIDCDLLIVKPRGFQTSISLDAAPIVPVPASLTSQANTG